jgi:hypothetical protein
MSDGRTPAFPDGWATLSCFSPPYLNCIDYTELYKIELWLMEHIASQEQFRETRLGTLRSHPSVKFPARNSFAGHEDEPAVKLSGRSCARTLRTCSTSGLPSTLCWKTAALPSA